MRTALTRIGSSQRRTRCRPADSAHWASSLSSAAATATCSVPPVLPASLGDGKVERSGRAAKAAKVAKGPLFKLPAGVVPLSNNSRRTDIISMMPDGPASPCCAVERSGGG